MQRGSLRVPSELIGFSASRSCETNFEESLSTSDDSPPSRDQYHQGRLNPEKEKSQLCKKFMEFGYCPYQRRCKFAHGCHELRKDQQRNSKYKTKHCGIFVNEGYCMYGNRCNFIHADSHPKEPSMTACDLEIAIIRYETREASRLLSIL